MNIALTVAGVVAAILVLIVVFLGAVSYALRDLDQGQEDIDY